jgi:hypothetical protein
MKTKFLGLRKPTTTEKSKGAEIVFLREDQAGNIIPVYGCKVYEGWEQWGAPIKVLQDNCNNIEDWRKKQKKS